MNPTRGEWLQMALKAASPVFLALGLILLAMLPYGMAYPGIIIPNVAVIVVYYWLIHRPDLMTPAIVFFIGLILDFLSGGPPGLNAISLLLVSIFVAKQDDILIRGSFLLVWAGLAVTAVGAGFVSWMVGSLYMADVLNVRPLLVQTLITIAFYPLFSWMFGRLHKSILE